MVLYEAKNNQGEFQAEFPPMEMLALTPLNFSGSLSDVCSGSFGMTAETAAGSAFPMPFFAFSDGDDEDEDDMEEDDFDDMEEEDFDDDEEDDFDEDEEDDDDFDDDEEDDYDYDDDDDFEYDEE